MFFFLLLVMPLLECVRHTADFLCNIHNHNDGPEPSISLTRAEVPLHIMEDCGKVWHFLEEHNLVGSFVSSYKNDFREISIKVEYCKMFGLAPLIHILQKRK